MRINYLFTTGIVVTLVISIVYCLNPQIALIIVRSQPGIPYEFPDMYIITYSPLGSLARFYPLVKVWICGMNLLLALFALINTCSLHSRWKFKEKWIFRSDPSYAR